MGFHSKSSEDALQYFSVTAEYGLPSSRVEEMREKYGANHLILQKPKPKIILLLEQFNNPVIYILIVAGVLNAILVGPKDAIVIGVVVILNTIIGFLQENKASNALKALRDMAAPSAKVIRDGKQKEIATIDVVCGDILVLESGVRAPADARLIDTQNLIVDESMLTGESFAVTKNHNEEISEDAPLGDRTTMIYSGTIIQKGRGLAVVTNVGINTEFGKISQKVAQAEETISPLQLQISQVGKVLSIAIVSIVIAIFIIGFIRGSGTSILEMFMASVALAVSAIPEGLPVAVTITLSIGVYQMAKHNAIVKKLAAVETLGSTNVICSDKTGTLTKNQMTVTRIYTGGKTFNVHGSGYTVEGAVIDTTARKQVFASEVPALEMVGFIGSACTESQIMPEGKKWKIIGDSTEGALMISAKKMDYKFEGKVFIDIPFESENQYMAVRAQKNGKSYILAKGAPEKILERCTKEITLEGETIPIDTKKLREKVSIYSRNGLRVLALAYLETCCEHPITAENLKEMIFVGFAAIQDSVRPEAIEAVKECHNAGIRVVMITGDNPQTAQAVAKEVGIAPNKEVPIAMRGSEIDNLSDETLYELVDDVDVYARVVPHHKYRIVQQLQKRGNIVAMTGDGVNDAPALKQADIGVAMGSGTDVAKESAHMVLLDDNFATIVKAVRRGRVVLHNLQHILIYILSTSFGGLLTIAMSVILGFPLPILPAQILWINLVTDGTSTFPLAFEKEHGDVMYFPPRKKSERLISNKMFWRMIISGFIMMVGTLSVFYFSMDGNMSSSNQSLKYAQTMAFCVLAFFQIWNVQNSRSIDRSLLFNLPYPKIINKHHPTEARLDKIGPFKNPILLAVMVLAILLQISAVEFEFMNNIFNTVNLDFDHWLIIIAVSISIIFIIEIIKFIEAVIFKKNFKLEHD